MTVSSIKPVNNYEGNGSNTIFDFDFLIEDKKELVVTHITADGIRTELIYGVDYSINEIGNKNGSYITFPLAKSSYDVLQSEEVLSLTLSLEIKQESEFHNSANLELDVLEWTFDYIIRVIQMLSSELSRTLKVKEGEDTNPDELLDSLNSAQKSCSVYSQNANLSYEKALAQAKISEEKAKSSEEQAKISTNQATIATNKVNEAIKKLDSTLNKSQITNCILSVEELVKVETSSSSALLTLKKGSIVYVSTNGTFNEVTIQSDVSAGSGGLFTQNADRNLYACYVPSLNDIRNIPVTQTYSQATAPSASSMLNNTYCGWFDTTNNIMKYTYDGGATWTICSLPFALGNPISGGTGWYQHIQQVFNGFGVVGQKTFATRGVKALLPNGRNSDGTLNNKEVVSTSFGIYDETGKSSWLCFWDGSRILTYGVTNYFEQDYKPTFSGNHATWLNTKENIMYQTSDGGTTWNTTGLRCFLGVLQKGSTGNITYFEASKPIELIKKSDFDKVKDYIIETGTSGNIEYTKWASGKIEQIGQVTGTATSGTITFAKAFSNKDSIRFLNGNFISTSSDTNGTSTALLISDVTTTSFRYSKNTSQNHFWYACGK